MSAEAVSTPPLAFDGVNWTRNPRNAERAVDLHGQPIPPAQPDVGWLAFHAHLYVPADYGEPVRRYGVVWRTADTPDPETGEAVPTLYCAEARRSQIHKLPPIVWPDDCWEAHAPTRPTTKRLLRDLAKARERQPLDTHALWLQAVETALLRFADDQGWVK